MFTHRIRTAACLIIGDEVLNGKIRDSNSHYFAKYCFELGIEMRRVCVVPDEEQDIMSTLRDLSKYDFVVTTGGIGPTHDDITYEAVAKAYNLPLELDEETELKMNLLAKRKPAECPPDQRAAQLRMATLPKGPNVTRSYVMDDVWVPIVGIDHRVYIFPGIPQLFEKLLECMKPQILPRIDTPVLQRRFVSTTRSESEIAKALGEIQDEYRSVGVKIGSYPHMHLSRNTVSIICPEDADADLERIVHQVVEAVGGEEITAEEEAANASR